MGGSAVVTGATSGIGAAAALALGDAGWWVLAGGRDDGRGRDLAEQLAERSGGGFAPGDITEPAVRRYLVERAVSETGRIDLLVNCAGIHFLAPLGSMEEEGYDRLLDVNLKAAVLLSKEVIPVMVEQGSGCIVNVASEAGLVAVPSQVAYNISKAGMIMLTRSITADYAHLGIRAVSICPGTTHTPLVEEAIASAPDPTAHKKALAESRPAKRLGTPEEVAAAVVFVASEQVGYLNGSELVIDGGYTVV